MSVTIRCRKCGHQNPVRGIFCTKCGNRLDPKDLKTTKDRSPGSFGGGTLVRLAVFLTLVAVLGLLVWPMEPVGEEGTPEAGRALLDKIRYTEDELNAGRTVAPVASEAEVNGYLAEAVRHTEPLGGPDWMRMELTSISARIDEAGVRSIVQAKWGPMLLSYELTGDTAASEDRAGIRWLCTHIGHLPVQPRAAQVWLARKLGTIFSNLHREAEILDHVTDVQTKDTKIRIVVSGRP